MVFTKHVYLEVTMPFLKLNTEHFSSELLHEAIENIASTAQEKEEPFYPIEYPEAQNLVNPKSSFYKAALEFCKEVLLEQSPLPQKLIENQLEDIVPYFDLLRMYPENNKLEVELLWLMVTRNWEAFQAQIEKENLTKILSETV